MGVVYHANYLVWCEVARTELIREVWTSYAEVERGGTKLAVSEASLRYKRGARYDDVVRVSARVTEVRSRTVSFAYDITLEDDTLLVTASTILVAVGPDGRSATLPLHLRNVLEGAIES